MRRPRTSLGRLDHEVGIKYISAMKTKGAILSLVAVCLALWGTWCAYHRGFDRGYSQGARDEFFCWNQEPIRTDSRFLIGRRELWKSPGGKLALHVVKVSRNQGVNAIPSTVYSP